ncbi:MAG: TlpA family protein disulfide reductase [Candidatus Krumholzibacteria bacterium]|nr:TlpA family protein disulfide reductase [Candidatus Krumholzibacteria bacterium]
MKRNTGILALAAAACLAVLAVAQKGDGAERAGAAEAYATVTAEVEALTDEIRRARTQERKLQLIDEIESKLVTFRSDYAETPEAADAAFHLGMIKSNLQAYEDAVKLLSEFVAKGGASAPRDKVAFAHYYLAEAHKGLGALDDARSEYMIVLNEYSDINPQLTQFTRASVKDLETARKLAVGAEPIPFEVVGIKGEKLSPAEFKGKVLLLDFWATWCGPCKVEMPNVKRVYEKYNKAGFEIVGISLDRSRNDLDAYIDKYDISWPQFFDGKYWQNDVAVQYGVRSIPATYLIDRKGKIRYKLLRGRQLELAVEKLLKESL